MSDIPRTVIIDLRLFLVEYENMDVGDKGIR